LQQRAIMTTPIRKQLDQALAELETAADEIRVQLHLAGMEANDVWSRKLAPRLLDARRHAREAGDASIAAVESTLEALRDFQRTL